MALEKHLILKTLWFLLVVCSWPIQRREKREEKFASCYVKYIYEMSKISCVLMYILLLDKKDKH